MATVLAHDTLAFLVLRESIRAVRDRGILGAEVATWVGSVLPLGYLGSWQFGAALVMGLALTGGYGRGDAWRDPGRIFRAVVLASALSFWAEAWQDPSFVLLFQFVITLAVVWSVISLNRAVLDKLVRLVIPERRAERVVFVGDSADEAAKRVHSRLRKANIISMAWVDVSPKGGLDPVSTVDEVWKALERTRADTVLLCGDFPARTFEAIVESSTSGGVRVLSVSRHDGVERRRPGLVWYGGSPFIELTVPSLKAPQLFVKRILDIAGSAAGLILLAPIFALVAIAIKLDSRGPVFFSQERVGYAGKVFRVWKFRTMRNGADGEKADLAHLNHTGDPRLFKIPNDPRITALGRFLRKWSIDEFPQLWNVFVGDMSLVGPRPFFEADLKTYLDHHFARLGAKPGITGMWQVKGRSGVADFEEVVRLDREYIDRWSLRLDLLILARTLPAVLKRTGAY